MIYEDFAHSKDLPYEVRSYSSLMKKLRVDEKLILPNKALYYSELNHFDPGAYVIFGQARSGKSTLARNLVHANWDESSCDFCLIDEPLDELIRVDLYGPNDLATFLNSFFTSEKPCCIIDSMRSMISSLGGPLMKGGVAVVFKDVLTEIHNTARRLNRCMFLVFCVDADLLLDVLGSSICLLFVDSFSFCYQFRHARFANEMANSNLGAPIKIESELRLHEMKGVRLANVGLVMPALRGDSLAITAMKKGWSVRRYENESFRSARASSGGDFVGDTLIPDLMSIESDGQDYGINLEMSISSEN